MLKAPNLRGGLILNPGSLGLTLDQIDLEVHTIVESQQTFGPKTKLAELCLPNNE